MFSIPAEVSQEAQKVIAAMLVVDPGKRVTLGEALARFSFLEGAEIDLK